MLKWVVASQLSNTRLFPNPMVVEVAGANKVYSDKPNGYDFHKYLILLDDRIILLDSQGGLDSSQLAIAVSKLESF